MDSQFNQIDSYVIAAVLIAAYFLFRRWRINRMHADDATAAEADDASLLMTMYTLGCGLEKMSSGQLGQMPYSLLMTTLKTHQTLSTGDRGIDGPLADEVHSVAEVPMGTFRTPPGQILLSINLPTASTVHFAGFNLKDSVFRQMLGNTGLDNELETVQLEGDFPDYFKLFCSKGRDIELREVLDPTAMVFLIDFCSNLNWELVGNNLYMVSPNVSQQAGGGEGMIHAAEGFAQKILPTLERMS